MSDRGRYLMSRAIRSLAGHGVKNWQITRDFSRVARRFLPHFRRQLGRLALAECAGLGFLLLGLLEPWPLKLIFDHIFLNKPLPVRFVRFEGLRADHRILFLNIIIRSILFL